MSYSSYGPEPTGRPEDSSGDGGSARSGRRRRSSGDFDGGQQPSGGWGDPAAQPTRPPQDPGPVRQGGRRSEAAFEDTQGMAAVPPAGPGPERAPNARPGYDRGPERGPAMGQGGARGPGGPGGPEHTQRIGPPGGGPGGSEWTQRMGQGGPEGPGGQERTQRIGPGGPGGPGTQGVGTSTGGFRRQQGTEETQAMQSGTRRRRGDAARRGRGPGSPGGPGGPDGPDGPRGPGGRGPRDFDDEPSGRSGWRRFVPSWKIVMVSAVVLVAGVFGMITVGYINTPLPTVTQSTATAQGSVIYYRDGKSVIGRVGEERVIVDISKIPQHVQDAVIAAENRTFMEDSGISFSGLMRSVWMTATGQQIQGASTITQQMARNYYDGLSKEVSMQRKVKEIFVAIKLNKTLSKDEILTQYLNTIYFGRGAYGIEAASRAFFDKHVWQLNAAQAAYLAGRIQNPGEFDKLEAAKNFAATQERFAYVIDGMALLNPKEYGQLPAKYGVQAGKLIDPKKFPKTVADDNKNVYGGLRGYMIVQVLQELKLRGLPPATVRSGGYKIVSTFDKQLMLAAKKAVQNTTSSMSKEFHAGLAAVDPRNGQVVAFYGGNDYVKDPWNEPFDSRKQAASAFKPYVLAAWLEAGFSLNSYVPGDKTRPDPLPGTTKITNGHRVPASIDVTYATAHSINTAFASMAFKLPNKLDDVRSIAEAAGISKQAIEEDENGANGASGHGYQLTIGSVAVTPVEQAAGYSIFANQGKHVDYHVVKEVRQGKSVVMPELRSAKQVIAPESAADSVAAMQQVLTVGTAQGQGIGRPAAGKTGTNNDQEDAWFVGFTPQLSTAVGMYREQCRTKKGKIVQPKFSNCDPKISSPHEVSLGFDGAGAPTRIWHDFMTAALAGQPVMQFPPKAGLGTPENIVPSPTPTPSPTDDFPSDIPTLDPNCLPGDISCGDNGDDPGIVGNGDDDPFNNGNGNDDPFGNQSPALPPPPATSRARRSPRPRRSDPMDL